MAMQVHIDNMKKEISDITNCSFCRDMFTDPRVLPCMHSFCFGCLDRSGKTKVPGDDLSCPFCRKTCAIPVNGVSGFPKNFFIEKLLEIKQLSTGAASKPVCVVCNDAKTASKHCVDCQENMCEKCADFHVKNKPCRLHKLVLIGDTQHSELVKMRSSHCEKHTSEALKMYCYECKSTMCVLCCIKDHRMHKCTDIEEISEEFKSRLKSDVRELSELLSQATSSRRELEQEEKRSLAEINSVKESILARGTAVKMKIDIHAQSLITKLDSMKDSNLEKVRLEIKDQDQQFAMLESMKKFCEELEEKGSACDIARIAEDLHSRTQELKDSHSSQTKYSSTEVMFKSTCLEKIMESSGDDNLVGKLHIKKRKIGEATKGNVTTPSASTVKKKGTGSRQTGYCAFKQIYIIKLRKKKSNRLLDFSEISKLCHDKWKSMSAQQRRVYEGKAKKDTVEHAKITPSSDSKEKKGEQGGTSRPNVRKGRKQNSSPGVFTLQKTIQVSTRQLGQSYRISPYVNSGVTTSDPLTYRSTSTDLG